MKHRILRTAIFMAIGASVAIMPTQAQVIWYEYGDVVLNNSSPNFNNGYYWQMEDTGIDNYLSGDRTISTTADLHFNIVGADVKWHNQQWNIVAADSNKRLTLDMANHNLTFGPGAYGFLLEPNARMNAINVTNFDHNTYWSNHILTNTNSIFSMDATNNITLQTAPTISDGVIAVENGGGILALNNSQVTLKAGNDISINDESPTVRNSNNAFDNPAFINSIGATVDVEAGHDLSIITTKPAAVAARTRDGDTSDVRLKANHTINLATTSKEAGFATLYTDSNSHIGIEAGNLEIQTNTKAIQPRNSGTDASTASSIDVNVTGSVNIQRGNDGVSDAPLVSASNYNTVTMNAKTINMSTHSGAVVAAANHGEVSLNATDSITLTRDLAGTQADMVYAKTQGHLILGTDNGVTHIVDNTHGTGIHSDNALIDVTGGIDIQGASIGVLADNNGQVNLNRAVSITSDTMAIKADNGKVIGNQSMGDKQIIGTMQAEQNGLVDLTFGTLNSYYQGETHPLTGGSIKLAFNPGARWNMTDNSEVTNLINNGFVDMSQARSDGSHGKLLDANTFSGNGNIAMHLDWDSNLGAKHLTANSDYIHVTNGSGGTQNVLVDYNGMNASHMSFTDRLYFATVDNSGLQFTSQEYNHISHPGQLYDDSFGVNHETNGSITDWYFGWRKQIRPVIPHAQATGQAMLSLATDLDTLTKRLGDARYMDASGQKGIWARSRYTHLGMSDFSGHSTRFEVGMNYPSQDKKGATLHRGMSAEYTTGRMSTQYGSGKLGRYSLGGYYTWLGKQGHYMDIVGRVGRISADSTSHDVTGPIKSDYGTWFESVSFEYGRKFAKPNGWFWEPQGQLQYAHVNSVSYRTSDGLAVHNDSVNSVIGRLGFRLGKEINPTTTWYVKADLLHEFAGSRDYGFTAIDGLTRIDSDVSGKRTWGDLGVGFKTQMTHDRSLWFDAERYLGNGIHNTWQLNGGMTWKI